MPRADIAVDLARRIVGLPMRRLRQFGLDTVNDVQWDMLLQLLIAERDGQRVTPQSLQIGSGAPIENARRFIRELIERRLVMLVCMPGRADVLGLTATARARVVRVLVGEPFGEQAPA